MQTFPAGKERDSMVSNFAQEVVQGDPEARSPGLPPSAMRGIAMSRSSSLPGSRRASTKLVRRSGSNLPLHCPQSQGTAPTIIGPLLSSLRGWFAFRLPTLPPVRHWFPQHDCLLRLGSERREFERSGDSRSFRIAQACRALPEPWWKLTVPIPRALRDPRRVGAWRGAAIQDAGGSRVAAVPRSGARGACRARSSVRIARSGSARRSGTRCWPNGAMSGCPVLGTRVDVGANVVILGPIQIGDDAVIGAGSVVVKDVPAGAVVAGNPARVIRSRSE